MSQYNTFDSSSTLQGYAWTGNNLENQIWSSLYVSTPMYVTSIGVRWAGYGGDAYAFHCLWHTAGSLITSGGTVTGAYRVAGGGNDVWYNQPVGDTYIDAGYYDVGIWCNPSYPRWWSRWKGAVNSTNWRRTTTGGIAGTDAVSYTDGGGAIACYLTGYDAGGIWINQLGTWKHGQVWVNQLGTWKKSNGVWVNHGSGPGATNGVWSRGI